MTKNWRKITAEKKKKFGSKPTIYLSLSLHKERSSYRRSLQLSKEAIQHFKTFTFFSTFVGHFCPPGSGSGSTDPIECGSNPDPQPWLRRSVGLDPARIGFVAGGGPGAAAGGRQLWLRDGDIRVSQHLPGTVQYPLFSSPIFPQRPYL